MSERDESLPELEKLLLLLFFLFDKISSESVSFGNHFSITFNTIDVFQVTLYLGNGGRSLNKPLKNRLTLSLFVACPGPRTARTGSCSGCHIEHRCKKVQLGILLHY